MDELRIKALEMAQAAHDADPAVTLTRAEKYYEFLTRDAATPELRVHTFGARWTKEEFDQADALYAQGHKWSAIAEKLGVSSGTLSFARKRAGRTKRQLHPKRDKLANAQ